MGDGGELERALDDVYATGVTVRSCCEKRFEKKNFAKVAKIIVAKVFENKFGQVVEKSFDLFLCLIGFVKARKFRDSSQFSDLGKELPPLL